MTYTVYLLKLVQDKWYVGTTPKWRKDIRYDEHTQGIGSQWTSRYPPINVVDTWDYEIPSQTFAFPNRDIGTGYLDIISFRNNSEILRPNSHRF